MQKKRKRGERMGFEMQDFEKRIAALEKKAKEQRSLSILMSSSLLLLALITYSQGSRIIELEKEILQLANIAGAVNKSIELLINILESLIKSIC